MTNTLLLREEICNSGLKYLFIAKKMNLTRYSLLRKVNNENEFKSSEIQALCEILNIQDLKKKERIFFADDVD